MAESLRKKSSPKKSSPRRRRKSTLGEDLSENDFFDLIELLEKRGDSKSMELRRRMIENLKRGRLSTV
jgi:hypothetical protein